MAGNFRLALRLARRELRGGLKGFRVFVACLMLGVATIAAVGSLAAGVTTALVADARVLLGGDVELSFTHREATAEQMRHLRDSGRLSSVAEMRAMARTPSQRTLIELKAVDDAYPLLGTIGLDGTNENFRDALAQRHGAWGAIVERATLNRLGLKIGDRVSVGDVSFAIRAVITNEPDRSANVFTLGPRVMVAFPALAETGLIQPGSLVRYQYRLMLNPGTDAAAWIADLKQRFANAGWRIRGVNEAAPGVQRWIDRIALYLTLVGLTALLVGGVGVANAVRSYLEGKRTTIATLKCLGASGALIVQVYLMQIMALAVLATLLGLVIGACAPALAAPLLAGQLPVAAQFGIYPAPLLLAAAYGLLTALAFSLWPIARAREISPAGLFRDLVAPTRRWPRLTYVTLTALSFATLAGLAVATAIDRPLAWAFVGGSAFTFALFQAAAWGIQRLARWSSHVRRPELRLGLANMHRPGSPTASVVMSLGLGLTVLVLIAEVQGSLSRQLREQLPDVAPSFFFIDIQPDQIADFNALLRANPKVGEIREVPALRGRIVKLAGVPVEQVPITPDAQWAVGSDRGLTYSPDPPPGSRVIAGQWWPRDYKGPPLVSFDAQIARGMGLGVGDTITINVLGRDIDATIANLRAIDWTTLGINFTLVFAPGTLESAPQTFIATAQVAADAEDEVERAVTDRFANVSTIRIKSALATIDKMLGDIAAAARVTAAVTLLAGTLVLTGAVFASQRRRIYDAVVLKVLGARRRDVVAAFLVEFGLVGAAAALVASAVGSLAGYLLLNFYMRIEFVFLPGVILATAAGATLIVIALGLTGTWRALGQKAAPLLRHP
jgi:putative ABC transport system permease protein